MKLIVITSPQFVRCETEILSSLFDAGLEILHLRKPESTEQELEKLIAGLPGCYLQRIVIHDHFPLAARWGLRGIHLNSRHPLPPPFHQGSISCSCHSIAEVCERKPSCDYLFLSPIFDSISKQGYRAGFPSDVLQQAHHKGIIDDKVMALGGVEFSRLPQLRQWGFGGAAMLGDIWQRSPEEILPHFQLCLQQAGM